MENITLDSLERHLDFFHTMYDVVRLVDPIKKSVLALSKNRFSCAGEECHGYWGDGGICDNCISIRAHLDGKCFMKLERSAEAIMLVTAMPVDSADPPVVVELLKNATETMLVGSGVYAQGHPMNEFIRGVNKTMVSDDLTGLYNRRFADERLPADIVRMLLEEKPLSVVFLDIDNLKTANDSLGHAFGDEIIRGVAGVVARQIREGDWAARLGGDEFLICLPDTPAQDARRAAERILEKIREETATREKGMTASVSMGVYTAKGAPLTAKELIERADERMYRAKALGKNRVYADQAD